jgi:hypothetical protein
MRNFVATIVGVPLAAVLTILWLDRGAGDRARRVAQGEHGATPTWDGELRHQAQAEAIETPKEGRDPGMRRQSPSSTSGSSTLAAIETTQLFLTDTSQNGYHEAPSSSSRSHFPQPELLSPMSGTCKLDVSMSERIAYWNTFTEAPVGPVPPTSRQEVETLAPLRVAPGVPSHMTYLARLAVQGSVSHGATFAKAVPLPIVYVHANLDEMRRHACVASSATSYYAGAIHVTAVQEPSILEQVRHEYAHHLLKSMGIDRPVWLHEGFAQYFSGEERRSGPMTKTVIDLNTMTKPLRTSSSEQEVTNFYEQASNMFMLLLRLSLADFGRDPVGLLDQLAVALRDGTTTPEGLFLWAIEQRGKNVLEGTPSAFWDDYVARGGFSEETLARINAERLARIQ